MSDKELQLQIERYIEGLLTQEEIESLWDDLIDKPEYREYLETLANLRRTSRSQGPIDSPTD